MDDATGESKARKMRWGAAGAVMLAWAGLAGWAVHDLERNRLDAEGFLEANLETAATIAETLVAADQASIDSELRRLRTELRAQDVWTHPGVLDRAGQPGPIESDAGAPSEPNERAVELRRIESVLRRALAGSASLSTLELVVAGHDGLAVVGVEREGENLRTIRRAGNEREGMAKALWYADEVSRAIVSSGRRIERGEVSFEGAIERPIARAVIGLHEPGELVQGALVASVDLSGIVLKLSAVVPSGLRLTLTSVEGRVLDPTRAAEPGSADRMAALAARIFDSGGTEGAFAADGFLVLGRPLVPGEGEVATALAVLEGEKPARGLAAWLASGWPASLVVLALVSGLAIVGLLRPRVSSAGSMETIRVSAPSAANEASGIALENQAILIREWLSDIRGCLEREAATRGLRFDLRCERSLPEDIRSDPGWLGGLVVAMGREALDATEGEGVVVEVREAAGDSLHVEFDAGGASLVPVGGMQEVATQMGARLERGEAGRIALVLPAVLA